MRRKYKHLTFLAEIDHFSTGKAFYRLTRRGLCQQESFEFDAEEKIIRAMGCPGPDEEIIITFTRRKK
jgi:hypothetical protein